MKKKVIMLSIILCIFIMIGCSNENEDLINYDDYDTINNIIVDSHFQVDPELIAEAEILIEAMKSGIKPTRYSLVDIRSRLYGQRNELQIFMFQNQDLYPEYCLQEAGWSCEGNRRDWTQHEIFTLLLDLLKAISDNNIENVFTVTE